MVLECFEWLQPDVTGRRCDRCVTEAFGSLVGDDPPGCTGCFCFDRSSRCRQAPYVWSEVSQLTFIVFSLDFSVRN